MVTTRPIPTPTPITALEGVLSPERAVCCVTVGAAGNVIMGEVVSKLDGDFVEICGVDPSLELEIRVTRALFCEVDSVAESVGIELKIGFTEVVEVDSIAVLVGNVGVEIIAELV